MDGNLHMSSHRDNMTEEQMGELGDKVTASERALEVGKAQIPKIIVDLTKVNMKNFPTFTKEVGFFYHDCHIKGNSVRAFSITMDQWHQLKCWVSEQNDMMVWNGEMYGKPVYVKSETL